MPHMLSADGEAPSQDVERSWKLYLSLWTALINGRGQPGTAGDASASSAGQLAYDALMSAVLDALKKLDLDYLQDQGSEAAAQAGSVPDIKKACFLVTLSSVLLPGTSAMLLLQLPQ